MGNRAKRPSRELIEKILDPQKIAELKNNDGQADYESSTLFGYLGFDSWEKNSALLLLTEIDPNMVSIEYGYHSSMGTWTDLVKIHHAFFLGRPNIYMVPSRDEVIGWIDEISEEHTAYLEKHGIVAPRGSELKWHMEKTAARNNHMMFLNLLENEYFNRVWEIRSRYAKQLTVRRAWWNSGKHEDRNSIAYYLNWASNKGLVIPWLEWAKSKGLLPSENTSAPTENLGVSNSLAVFLEMVNLRAREISLNIKSDRLRVGVSARGKNSSVSMIDFKLINDKRDRLLKIGEVLLSLARGEYYYDPNDRNHSRLGKVIKDALGLVDSAFKDGKPSFKIRVSEDETAKYTARKTEVNWQDWDQRSSGEGDYPEDYDPSNNTPHY